jgi:hypothetical protein
MNKVQKFVLIEITMAITFSMVLTIGNPAFGIEYTNEKCGVSIPYHKDWQVENNDYKAENLKSIITITPDPDDVLTQIYINIWDISHHGENTIEYVSKIFTPVDSGEEIKTEVIQDNIIHVGDFSAQKLAYNDEFEGFKSYIMYINILAYDKVYQIELLAENQNKFNKHVLLVEEIANSIKISKPNFEGINC